VTFTDGHVEIKTDPEADGMLQVKLAERLKEHELQAIKLDNVKLDN
jgi:hypothetical protein